MAHSEPLWGCGEDNDGWYLERLGSNEQHAFGLSAKDARRIIACVNACRGLDTALLENITMLDDTLLARINALQSELRT